MDVLLNMKRGLAGHLHGKSQLELARTADLNLCREIQTRNADVK